MKFSYHYEMQYVQNINGEASEMFHQLNELLFYAYATQQVLFNTLNFVGGLISSNQLLFIILWLS